MVIAIAVIIIIIITTTLTIVFVAHATATCQWRGFYVQLCMCVNSTISVIVLPLGTAFRVSASTPKAGIETVSMKLGMP